MRNRLLSLVPSLLLCVQIPAWAGVYSVVANPAENCSTQVNIGWQADLADTACAVVYTTKADAAWAQAATVAGKGDRCDIFDGISSKTPAGKDWSEEAKFLDYGLTLTGLRPDTEYMYKIVAAPATDSGQDASTGSGHGSQVRYFKTAGAAEFSFLWFSDVHAYTPIPNRVKNMNRVIAEALKIEPSVDFIFSTGDVVAWGASYSFWKDLFEQPFAANYLFADVIGNHDFMVRGGGGTSDYFRVAHHNPANGYAGQEGVCYWFLYGDALFLTFNNEAMKLNDAEKAAAKKWAAGVIEKLKGKYRTIWIAEHYQWFDGRNGKTSWYEHWKEFCDEHRVRMALSGNNHVYGRTHPLFADKVVPDGQGTVYMQAPSSDGERGVKAGKLQFNADKLAFTYSSQEHSNATEVKTIGCVLVDVGPTRIRTRLVYIDGNGAVQVADDHSTAIAQSAAGKE